MNEAKETFQRQTITALNRCADYLRDNAEDLARRFSDETHGCKEWSIGFRAGEDGIFPWIEVHETVRTAGIINAYCSENVNVSGILKSREGGEVRRVDRGSGNVGRYGHVLSLALLRPETR